MTGAPLSAQGELAETGPSRTTIRVHRVGRCVHRRARTRGARSNVLFMASEDAPAERACPRLVHAPPADSAPPRGDRRAAAMQRTARSRGRRESSGCRSGERSSPRANGRTRGQARGNGPRGFGRRARARSSSNGSETCGKELRLSPPNPREPLVARGWPQGDRARWCARGNASRVRALLGARPPCG